MKEEGEGAGGGAEDEMHASMDICLSKFWEIVKDREAWCAAVHEITNIWIPLSNWTTATAPPKYERRQNTKEVSGGDWAINTLRVNF